MFQYTPNPTYVVAEFKLVMCLVEKVGQGRRLCNCVNIQLFVGYPGAEEGKGRGFKIVLMELNPIYAVPKFELAKCLMKKVGQS